MSLGARVSDLTKTIRARGRQGLHREAEHTTVPDPHATLRSTSCLPTRGASTYEQDGAHHLGADGHGGELPRTEGVGRARRIGTVRTGNHEHGASRHASAMVPTRCGQDGERSRGKRSVRRGRKNQLPYDEPWSSRKRFGSDLTKTIRARGRQGLHREAEHTTVPDPHATLRSTSCLPTRGASTYVRRAWCLSGLFPTYKYGSAHRCASPQRGRCRR